MFHNRLHILVAGESIDRRILEELFMNSAANLSYVDDGAIGLKQFSRQDLGLSDFIDLAYAWNKPTATDYSGDQWVNGDFEVVRDTKISVSGYDGASSYKIIWNIDIEVRNATTWFAIGFPFIGDVKLPADRSYVMNPFSARYGVASDPLAPNVYYVNGNEISLGGTAIAELADDSPALVGVVVGMNPGGELKIKRASLSLVKFKNV
jgi:hypothetical protein